MAKVRKNEREYIREALRVAYPDAACALEFHDLFQLLVSVVLSAQTTDKRVNEVTPHLFSKWPDAATLSMAESEDVEKILRPLGMYRSKAKNIIALSRVLNATGDGAVPGTYDELIALPGVGRKTANVVLAVGFSVPRIAVDTHVFRLANRIGLTQEADVLRTEEELMRILPREDWIMMHHALIMHGRQVCMARTPRCSGCVLRSWCRRNDLPPLPKGESRVDNVKICVPLVGGDAEEIAEEIAEILPKKPDIIEWRGDRFTAKNTEKILEYAPELRQRIGEEMILLFTFRSIEEGGSGKLERDDYFELLRQVAKTGAVNWIDVEWGAGGDDLRRCIDFLKKEGVTVVLSKHDEKKTPSKDKMEQALTGMLADGADIAKLAVTATKEEDVLRLLHVTAAVRRRSNNPSLITISMGEMGELSRIYGWMYGSGVTFASGKKASAPGQVKMDQLRSILEMLSAAPIDKKGATK